MHKISKPAKSPGAHFLGSRPKKETLLHLYRSLIRSKLDYGCIVYGSVMLFVCAWVLTELLPHPVYAWKQMSPLSILDGKKLSLQYCLKLSSNYNNPAYAIVFNSKFHSIFERKPTQLPPLAMRVSGDLQAVGFKKNDVITSAIPSTPPWL